MPWFSAPQCRPVLGTVKVVPARARLTAAWAGLHLDPACAPAFHGSYEEPGTTKISLTEVSTLPGDCHTSHPPPARSTTSSPAPAADPPASTAAASCAPSTTSSPSTAGAGNYASTPTAPPPPPSATAPSTATHPPPRNRAAGLFPRTGQVLGVLYTSTQESCSARPRLGQAR